MFTETSESSSPETLKAVHRILCEDNGLSTLCTQNGWIDNDTIWFEVDQSDAEGARVSVHFEEVVMKGGGCVAKRQPCWGRVRLQWRARGNRIQAL